MNFKKNALLAMFIAVLSFSCATMQSKSYKDVPTVPKGWKLKWVENFNGNKIDWSVWSKCERCTNADWCNTMSPDSTLYAVKDGHLILRGIKNPDMSKDKSPYLTGGIWTKGKKSFGPNFFIEVKAKLQGAKGAWPAIWMLPFDSKAGWPDGGEIDIMERLNFEADAYQTVHSHYTFDLGRTANPLSTKKSPINPNDYNVYGVEVTPDYVQYYINGKPTLKYPKINDGKEGQFPYNEPMFLIIDMQLGGNWVGAVDSADLPVEMDVDWVKYYQK